MLTSNLKIIDENTTYISPTQKFQYVLPSSKYEDDDLNVRGAGNNDVSCVTGKLIYGSQKDKSHFGTEIAPKKNVLDHTKLINFAEGKGESTSAFRKR